MNYGDIILLDTAPIRDALDYMDILSHELNGITTRKLPSLAQSFLNNYISVGPTYVSDDIVSRMDFSYGSFDLTYGEALTFLESRDDDGMVVIDGYEVDIEEDMSGLFSIDCVADELLLNVNQVLHEDLLLQLNRNNAFLDLHYIDETSMAATVIPRTYHAFSKIDPIENVRSYTNPQMFLTFPEQVLEGLDKYDPAKLVISLHDAELYDAENKTIQRYSDIWGCKNRW